MQKSKLFNVLNSILLSLLFLISGITLVMNQFKNVERVIAENIVLIEGVDAGLYKIDRNYKGITSDGEFTYPNEDATPSELENKKIIDGNYEDPKFTMLYNDTAKYNANIAVPGTAENIYFTFGKPQSEIVASKDESIKYINDLNVKILFNGKPIFVNPNKPLDSESPEEKIPLTSSHNSYFTQYIDATNVYYKDETGKGARITDANGLYEIEVNYQVTVVNRSFINNEWTYNSTTVLDKTTMKYSFYLLDESSYINYPEFDVETISNGPRDNSNIIQYFYNFNKSKYPAYNYDASKFNVELSKAKDKKTTIYNSTFTLNEDATIGTLTFTNSEDPLDTYKKEIPKVDNTFPVTLNFTDLSVYTIKNRYIVNINNSYKVCDNIIAKSELYGEEGKELTENECQFKLHVFGFIPNFNNSGTKDKLLMLNKGEIKTNNFLLINEDITKTLYSDVSSIIKELKIDISDAETNKIYNKIISNDSKNNVYKNFNVVSTNQPPISFLYFGEYSYTGIKSNSNIYKYKSLDDSEKANFNTLRKDAYIEDAGYYEVIVNYTYQDFAIEDLVTKDKIYTQVFLFTINNTSPTVKIEEVTEDKNPINENGFTNKSVKFIINPDIVGQVDNIKKINDDYFNAPILVKVTETNYSNNNHNEYVYNEGTILDKNAKYTVKVSYGLNGISEDTYKFVIDKNSIQNVRPQAVDVVYEPNSDNILYYQFLDDSNKSILNEYYNNSTLFNQPFTLLFDEKDSGAKITASYKRIYFKKNLTAGSIVNGVDETYLTTNYELDLNSIPQSSKYSFDKDLIKHNKASVESVFDLDTSCLILFYLVDEAGNEFRYYIVYDLTKPFVNINPVIENPYNIVSAETTVTWGDYKAIKVIGDLNNVIVNSEERYSDYITPSDPIFSKIYKTGTEGYVESKYLTIPINQIYLKYIDENDKFVKNYYVKDYNPNDESKYQLHLIDSIPGDKYQIFNFVDHLTITPGGNGEVTDHKTAYFVGEKDITYNISDKSNIRNEHSTINNDNSYTNNIWLNLDKSLGLGFIKLEESTTNYGSLLKEKSPINGNQLRFSYLPGKDNYAVSSITYDYYEIDAESYTRDMTVVYEENEPTPYFPYKVAPTLSNQPLQIDSSVVKIDDPDRKFSEIVNQDTINGEIRTKDGMYVFKRTYAGDVETDKTRYYVFYIDKSGIIEIDAELENKPNIHYQQGYGFVLNFGNDGTKFTALQIQQYLASLGNEYSLFTSNKLPINLEIPFDKFNTQSLLQNPNTNPKYKEPEYFAKVKNYNQNLFNLTTTIRIESIVNNMTNTTNLIESDFSKTDRNDLFKLNCKNPGTYIVTIKDSSGYRYNDDNNYNCNVQKFKYDITHNAPNANYHTKDLDTNVSNKESDKNSVNYQEFVSTNSKVLQLSFDKNNDKYKATIDTKNFNVTRNGNKIFYLSNNQAFLNGQLIYTITDNVPIINNELETKYSSVVKNNGDVFEVSKEDNLVKGFYNGSLVYTFVNGGFQYPNDNKEFEKYKDVFGSTLSRFEIKNNVATLTTYKNADDHIGHSEIIFELTNSIPIAPDKQIAKEYENIYAFDESTNKYIITIFNANDKNHKYISNYLTESNYKVELFFEGNPEDYKSSYNENGSTITTNYFSKQFAITVDRTAPSFNYNKLVKSDKFYLNKSEIDKNNYFFAVNSDFIFTKQNELESNQIFYRYIADPNTYNFSYSYTITPDNPIYNTGELSNNIRFIETATDNDGNLIFNSMSYGKFSENFDKNSAPLRFGYYEIIERDEAGNYNVYGIYYNNPKTTLDFIYEQAESNGIIKNEDETLKDSEEEYTIKGQIVDNRNIPVDNILVKVKNTEFQTTTKEGGMFIFEGLTHINTIQFISTDYSFVPNEFKVNKANYEYILNEETGEETNLLKINAYKKMKGTLNQSNTSLIASGQNLKFNESTFVSNDLYLKALITKPNGEIVVIENKPEATMADENTLWIPFLQKLNSIINEYTTENSYGFTFNIEFVNRFFENYNLKYVLPGIMLDPIINETEPNKKFTFTIPSDPSKTTFITNVEVKKFTGGNNGSWSIIARDSNNTTINKYNDGKPLDLSTYTFTNGEYMFVLTDNFNRVSTHYKGVGVNDVRKINYGTSEIINNITYTASPVTLEYQTALYKLKVVEVMADGTKHEITNNLKENNILEISNVNDVIKLQFHNNEVQGNIVNEVVLDGIRHFIVSLHVQKLDLTYTYNFIINKTNPKIELRNLSGEKLKETSNDINNPTIHSEDFSITWDNKNELLFNPKVRLTRTYFEDNSLKEQVIESIPNGYKIMAEGTYKAEIYNELGFSDPNKTIYFKRIDGNIVMYTVIKTDTNGYEKELQVSSDMPNIYLTAPDGDAEPLYKYYALKYQTGTDEAPSFSYDFIEIRVNPSKGLTYKKITEADNVFDNQGILITSESNVYRIFGEEGEDGTVSYGYSRYIQIVYILSNSDFVKANIESDEHSYTNASATLGESLKDNIKNTASEIRISFPGFNGEIGNPIKLYYTFNGIPVETIYNFSGITNNLTLKNAGIYELSFYDLAGNIQKYNLVSGTSKNKFTISLINNVLFVINGKTPIENEIFNSSVTLEITNLEMYDNKDVKLTATRNGKEVELVIPPNSSYNTYLFEGQGYYTITMTAKVTSDLSDIQQVEIVTVYNFTIINPNQAVRSFNIPLNPNFTIKRVLRENVNITHTLTNNKELWISCGDENTKTGVYTITVNAYIPGVKDYREFTFKVWINDESPVIISSIPFGSSTTKRITLTFNKNLIYQQIGDSIIRITGLPDIIINEETSLENMKENVELVENRVYTIQVLTSDEKVITSYKVVKKEPLNTISIIVIVVSSIVAVGLIITFVVLRKHIKYK